MAGKVGFIGLGAMGGPMALNLAKAGFALVVHDIDKAKAKPLKAKGAEVADSAQAVAAAAERTIVIVETTEQAESVILGAHGIIRGARPGHIVLCMATIDPFAARTIADRLAALGIAMLDAPVSGGEPKAIEGTLAIMAGGPQQAFAEVKDILGVMGASVTRGGEIGSGNVTKLANQIIVALNIAALSEAMVLATKAGVDPRMVFQAIRAGLAGSTVMDAKMPMILAGNFKPGFRIELHIKDLMNALDTAHSLGVPIPLSSQVLEIMQALKVDGKAGNDHSGLVEFYENLAKVQVRG